MLGARIFWQMDFISLHGFIQILLSVEVFLLVETSSAPLVTSNARFYLVEFLLVETSSVPLVTSNSRIILIESVEGFPIRISSMISLIVFSNLSTDSFDSETLSTSLSTKLFNIWAS